MWSTSLTSSHTVPVLVSDRVSLTAADGEELLTICIRRL